MRHVSIAQGELIDAIVQGDEDGGAGAIERHDGHDLVTSGGTDEAGALVPNADDGAHRPVVVHDGTAIQRIPAQHILAILKRKESWNGLEETGGELGE